MNNLFSRSTLQVVGAGALGGFLGYLLGEMFSNGMSPDRDIVEVFVATMMWTAIIAFALGPCILVGENYISLRGKWHRDLIKGVIAFPIVGLLSGLGAQIFYTVGMAIAQGNSGSQVLARALGWMLLGIGLGVGIGAVRFDFKAALRGGFGGAAGGFLGGLCFNFLAGLSNDSASRFFGLIVLGAAIAFCIRFAEQSLKTAWLLGISTGPYEGKESPLNKARVSVGRSDAADLSLYRDETVPDILGELVFQNGGWLWQGQSVEIDGQQQTYAPLQNGSILQFGTYRFRFMSRSEQALNPVSATPIQYQKAAPVTPPVVATAPVQHSGPILLKPLVSRFLPLELSGTSHSLGRALDNDLVVSEATVSSNHAHFFLERGAWNLKDVGSTNGTYVNENRLGEGPIKLRIGDKVRFGSAEFEVVPLS